MRIVIVMFLVADSRYQLAITTVSWAPRFKAGSRPADSPSVSFSRKKRREEDCHLLLLSSAGINQVQHHPRPDRQHGGQHALDQYQEGAVQVCEHIIIEGFRAEIGP